jgi:cellulose synthase/poly-beta-1,6-N-acetylglucosamine synthase-like glycosyltransferase
MVYQLMMVDTILLIPVVILAYAWLAYPLLLRLLAAGRAARVPDSDGPMPKVAILLSAHNEERHIRERIENILRLDYPPDRISLFVGIDGSIDRTAAIAGETAGNDDRIRVVEFPENRGKIAVLKDLVAGCRPDTLLVFTDANTMFRRDALKKLVSRFGDAAVGGVCGRLVLLPAAGASAETVVPGSGSEGEQAYWTWESAMKQMESDLDSCLGGNGAIYALRPSLFWVGIPENTIIDDFVLGMKVREQGFRMIYEPGAVADEEAPVSVKQEWNRRVRIGAGDYQALGLCAGCLHPSFGWFAWAFWSHKVLRWLTPHLFIIAAAGVVWRGGMALDRFVSGTPSHGATAMWVALLAGLVAFLGCASIGRVLRKADSAGTALFRWCDYFVTINAALMAGFVRFCRGNLSGRWQRTPRTGKGT